MAQITSNGRFGICDKRSDFTNVNPYNINGAFIMYVNNDDKIYYFILTSTTSTSSVTPIMSDIPGLNEFPTDTQTHVPAISIYTDNSDQSKTLNSKVYNGAKQWYNNNEFDGTHYISIDSLIIDNVIMSQYDGNYGEYSIAIDNNYNNYMIIKNFGGSEILKIFSDGSVSVTSTIAPDTTTPTTTTELDTTTPTTTNIPELNIFPTDSYTWMPGIRIYTDNSDQSKALNSKLYSDAQQYLEYYNKIAITSNIAIGIDTLIIDNVTIDAYNNKYLYSIRIYDNRITLEDIDMYEIELLTIFSDGSVTIKSMPGTDATTSSTATVTVTNPDSVTGTPLPRTTTPTTTPGYIKVEPTGLVNNPFTPTHTDIPYVILYTEDDNAEHHKYNEALYENIMIDHNNHYNIEKNCLIINDRIIPCSDINYNYQPFTLHVDFERKYISVHGADYAEIGVLYDNYIFELTDEVINLEYLESLNIFDHSTIGQNSTPTPNTTTTPNSTVTATTTYNPDSTTPTTTEYVTTPTTTSSTATQNPDLCNKKFTIYARVHDENGNIISNFNINNIIKSYGYGENYTRVYNDNSIIVYEFDNISPTYTHSIAPILNENYYFEEEDNIELYNIGNENIVNYSNSLIFWPGGITGDEAWIYVDIYPRSIYTTTSPASTMTTTNHSTDTTTPSPDTTTPITTGYSTTLTTTELVTTPTTTSSTATVTVTNPDNVTGTPLPRTTTTTSHSTTLTTTDLVTTLTTSPIPDSNLTKIIKIWYHTDTYTCTPSDVLDTIKFGGSEDSFHYVNHDDDNRKYTEVIATETYSFIPRLKYPVKNVYGDNNLYYGITYDNMGINVDFKDRYQSETLCLTIVIVDGDITTPTTTSSTVTVTATYNPDSTTPTTTSSTATVTVTPTITPIQEDIPICVNVHFNGNNYVYEDNIDDRFFVYGNRFSLTFDKYRPYSYESFDITHDDSLINVTIGTAVDGVYIGCLYLSGDICRASNMHNIYININTATTTANKDEIDDSIDDIAPR